MLMVNLKLSYKIGIVSSSLVRCPPFGYGSEITTYWLSRGLAERGHEVTLYCAPNLRKHYEGMNVKFTPCSYGLISYDAESKVVEWYADDLAKHDILIDASATCITTEYIHYKVKHIPHIYVRNGLDFFHPRFARHNAVVLSKLAYEHALQGRSTWEGSKYQSQYDSYPGRLKDARIVNYGIPLDKYKPCYEKDDYILFLSRFHPAKGVYEAIELAKKYNFKLVVAGSTEFPDHAYHYTKILETVNGMGNVKLVKDPCFDEKVELLGRAKALLYPLQYVEAFGLLIVEALATGTPVLTYKRWVTSELHDGVLELNEENLEKVLKGDVDYEGCRRFAEKFSVKRMVSEYEELAGRVVNGETWG